MLQKYIFKFLRKFTLKSAAPAKGHSPANQTNKQAAKTERAAKPRRHSHEKELSAEHEHREPGFERREKKRDRPRFPADSARSGHQRKRAGGGRKNFHDNDRGLHTPEPEENLSPEVLIEPVPISAEFEQLGLRPELLAAVAARGHSTPTPVQKEAIPLVLSGKDLLVRARTGTGKTAAFALPLLQFLMGRAVAHRKPRALILTPTRELAAQVNEFVKAYAVNSSMKTAELIGGVSYDPQIRALKGGADIIVATPGRLMDHAGRGTADLSEVEFLVIDEADRMLDMGFIHDIRKIIKMLPAQRQNMLFSATYPPEVMSLAYDILKDPKVLEIESGVPEELIKQVVYPVEKIRKRDLLCQLIKNGELDRALVFTRTKIGAERLAGHLNDRNIDADAVHGDKTQAARSAALDKFKKGHIKFLVATDVAARGLDIKELPHVVNYDTPDEPEDYIHRIGRTGRAGVSGAAVTLVGRDEKPWLEEIERALGKEIPRGHIEGMTEKFLETDPNRAPRCVFSSRKFRKRR